MTAQQLKNSILQMAVQGKLVPQDPSDEPASVLLERIRAEKEQLIKQKKIKREKNPSYIFRGADNTPYEKIGNNDPVSIADEVPFEIPDTWEWVTLKMIAVSELGKTLDKAKNQGTFRPYLCSINVYWNGISLDTVKQARFEDDELPRYCLRQGDLLICEGGDVGRSAVWTDTQEMYYQNALHRVRFYGGINPFYFQMLLECYKGNKILDTHSKGMTIKHLVQASLNSIYFPLPPVNEQHRIVNAVKGILPYLQKYNSVESELTALNSNFPKQLRNSILQMAVQGKLVHQDPDDEPASVLLARIHAEKQRLVKEGKIKRDKHESVIFRRDNSHYEKLDGIERCIDDEIPFEIPDSWEWIRMGSLFTVNPRNAISDDTVVGFMPMPLLQAGFSASHTFEERQWKDIKSGFTHFADNDVVIAKITPCFQNRKSAVICDLPNGYGAGSTELHVLRDYTKMLYMPYFLLFCKTHAFILDGMKNFTGTAGQQRVGKDFISNYLVPLPPVEEQKRIVQRANFVIKSCDIL